MSDTDRLDLVMLRSIARSIDLPLPDAAMPGIVAQARLLQDHVARVMAFTLPDDTPVAPEFRP